VDLDVQYRECLGIQNMNIQGCDAMWKGIQVYQGGIIVENSTIQDAEEGIFTSTALGNSVTVTNSRFIANKKGVIINYPSNLYSLYALPGVISSTEFNGTDFDLKGPYPGQQNWTAKAQIGFEVNQLASEYLITGTPDEPSFFKNLPVGIGMQDARLSVSNTKFDNIRGASTFGEEHINQYNGFLIKGFRNANIGAAIWSAGTGNLIVEGLGIEDNDDDMFRDVGNALLIFNTQFSLSNAKMFDVDWGVRSSQFFNSSVTNLVENNRINYNNVGLIFTHVGDHTTTATGNTLFNGENKRTFGIYGLKFSGRFLNQSSFNFTDNNITLRYGRNPDLEGFGIGVLNANKANIQGNIITALDYVSGGSTNFAGINIRNSDDATICSNEVIGWNTSRGIGINVNNSMGCKINCNTVDLFRQGLRFVGNCETADGIAANIIGDTRVGLQVEPFYEGDEAIGRQFHTGNRWEDEDLGVFDIHARYLGSFDNLVDNRITVTQNELFIDPEVVDPDQWFVKDNLGGDLICGSTLTDLCTDNQSPTVEITPGGTIDKLAKKEKIPNNSSVPLAEYLKRKISDRVEANYAENTPMAYQSFMNEQQQSQAGALGEIDENWSHIGTFETSLRATIREKENELSELESDYRHRRAVFAAASINEKINYLQSGMDDLFLDRLKEKSSQLNDLLSSYSVEKAILLNDLKTDNGNVYTTKAFRNSEKTVNNFAIGLVQSEDVSELVKWIEPIAAQCPKEGGVAVFKARTLVSMLTGFPYEAVNDCGATKKEENEITEDLSNSDYRIYPNPADGFVNVIQNSKNEEGVYQLYNAQGQVMSRGELVDTQTRISTADLPAGIYILKIHSSNSKVFIHNFVVIH